MVKTSSFFDLPLIVPNKNMLDNGPHNMLQIKTTSYCHQNVNRVKQIDLKSSKHVNIVN